MMQFFKTKTGRWASSRINRYTLQWQHRLAAKLNQAQHRWTQRRKKQFLLLFCLLAGSGSCYFLMSGLARAPDYRNSLHIGVLSAPAHVLQPTEQPDYNAQLKKQVAAIRGQLQKVDPDSLKQRPGLIDSLHQLEQFLNH